MVIIIKEQILCANLLSLAKDCAVNQNSQRSIVFWGISICLTIYLDKLANQQVETNCLYFCGTVLHQEECMSAKMEHLLRRHHESNELTTTPMCNPPKRLLIGIIILYKQNCHIQWPFFYATYSMPNALWRHTDRSVIA